MRRVGGKRAHKSMCEMYSTVKVWNGCAPVNVNGGSSLLVKDGVLDARRVARVEVVAETVVHAVVPVGRLSQLLCEILICEPQRYTLYIELEVKVQFSDFRAFFRTLLVC